jgi:prephenate dehydrogenase
VIFCAAPVGALPDLAAEALDAAGAEAAVTDVGSVKGGTVAALGEDPRFVGGHPLAGAETSGVDNARADLFDGARWYLTPTPQTGGVVYDRVQRVIADLGARPRAIDAAEHDRLMATVSHLPHVLANVLVEQAAESLAAGEDDRLPEMGPSFRDATRVAGANPAIWGDIFGGNRAILADEVDAAAKRLSDAADLIRKADAEGLGDWQREAAVARRELLEADHAGGPLVELRLIVPNKPGIVAELALALGRGGVNIEDMGLHPAADMKTGAVSLFVAGDDQAERATKLVNELGHDVTRLDR